MTIDMAQFHQVFFEESFEGLDAMETGLLELDPGNIDTEELNTIFRAAHSIKGGSGTFGFNQVSNYTHVMETLLDEMRDRRRSVTQPALNLLLGSVDCLREMLNALQDGNEIDEASVSTHKNLLDQELGGSGITETEVIPESNSDSPTVPVILGDDVEPGWHIAFSPHKPLLRFGNDPVRLIRELADLGELSVVVDCQSLPSFYDLDPEDCHLSWDLKIKGDISRVDIDDIFDWVEDDCDLAIRSFAEVHAGQEQSIQADPQSAEKIHEPAVTADENQENPEPEQAAQPDKTVCAQESKATKKSTAKNTGSSSIRVDTSKIDTLINMVGELIITQSMLSLLGETFEANKLDQLQSGLGQLERHTRELQESVMNIRMLPISFVFSRFPRLVHDLSSKMGKKIELKLSGETTEVDKTVIELISDPLVHLLRNSLDHGIEMPEDRIAVGKPETGTIHLNAFHRGGNIIIEVSDDGKGLDKEQLRAKALEKGLIEEHTILTDKQIYNLIFMPGFSTADQVSEVSGRGVGMDVVNKNIQGLGGSVNIESNLGIGTTMAIHLPLTLAILDGQSVVVGNEIYIVPLVSIIESISLSPDNISLVAGKGEAFKLRDEYLPIIRMHKIFQVEAPKSTELSEGMLVVVEGQGFRCGLFVDGLLGQYQVVIKSLEANYRKINGISGATILGNGSVALILDVPGLNRLSQSSEQHYA